MLLIQHSQLISNSHIYTDRTTYYHWNAKELALKLKDSRSQIVDELKISQGKAVDVGGKNFIAC